MAHNSTPSILDLDNLSSVETFAWETLTSPQMDLLALATVDSHTNPEVRHLVKRGADRQACQIQLWTDTRSPKVNSLKHNPVVSLSGYNANLEVQICCRGVASLHHQDRISEAAWMKATNYNKLAYCRIAQGQILSSRLAADLVSAENMDEDLLEAGYEHFMVITVAVEVLDFLHLHRSGNSRARFSYGANLQLVEANWLA